MHISQVNERNLCHTCVGNPSATCGADLPASRGSYCGGASSLCRSTTDSDSCHREFWLSAFINVATSVASRKRRSGNAANAGCFRALFCVEGRSEDGSEVCGICEEADGDDTEMSVGAHQRCGGRHRHPFGAYSLSQPVGPAGIEICGL